MEQKSHGKMGGYHHGITPVSRVFSSHPNLILRPFIGLKKKNFIYTLYHAREKQSCGFDVQGDGNSSGGSKKKHLIFLEDGLPGLVIKW